jgi:hypothetical protein
MQFQGSTQNVAPTSEVREPLCFLCGKELKRTGARYLAVSHS